MALGLVTPIAFVPMTELDADPAKYSKTRSDVLLREHHVAWALVGAIRGDEYGARLIQAFMKGFIPSQKPLNASQIAVTCKMAAEDYQKVQATRILLGKPPFTDTDNAPQTLFLDQSNPWPVNICPQLPIPEMHCEEIRLTGSTPAWYLSSGNKAYQCTSSGFNTSSSSMAKANITSAVGPGVPAVTLTPKPPLTLGTPETMKAASTDFLDDQKLYAPDSGSDSDPKVQYHFNIGRNLYVIESAGMAVLNRVDMPQEVVGVPANGTYIDGPVYYLPYRDDIIVLYQMDMPDETAQQKMTDAYVYLARASIGSRSPKWSISGIPPGGAPGVTSGQLIFVGSRGFLGAINLDTGKYWWCLRDLDKNSQSPFKSVKTPVMRNDEVVLEDAKTDAYGEHYYVAVNLKTQAINTNVPYSKPLSVTDDCPYFR